MKKLLLKGPCPRCQHQLLASNGMSPSSSNPTSSDDVLCRDLICLVNPRSFTGEALNILCGAFPGGSHATSNCPLCFLKGL